MPSSPFASEAFCSPLPEVLRDFGMPARTRLVSHWTVANGQRLHSRENPEGNAIPFVFIHGLVISSLYWIPLAEVLAPTHPVYALDLPGFGRSTTNPRTLTLAEQAAAILAWMEARGLARCHLVANSLGCQIAAQVVAEHPDRFESLTLIGSTLDPSAPHLLRQFFRLVRDALHEPPKLWVNWLVDFFRCGLGRAWTMTQQMLNDRIEISARRIAIPTLVLRGSQDPAMPQAWAEQLTALVPRGDLIVVPDHAHCVHYSAPVTVAALLQRWIAQRPNAVPSGAPRA